MADVNAVLQAAQQRLGQNQSTTENFSGIMIDALQGLFDVAEDTTSTGSRVQEGRTVYTTPLQVQVEQLAGLEAQNRTQQFAKQIGINPDYAADIQMQLAQQIQEATMAAMQQNKKVSELNQVGLFDDPLQFMVNQVLLPDEQNKLAAHMSTVEQGRASLQAINQATQQTAQTSNAIKTDITTASIADQISAAQTELDNKKALLGVEANLRAASTIKQVYDLQGDRFNIAKDIYNVQRGAEQDAMQRESHALARQQASLAMEKYQDEKDRLAYITKAINAAEVDRYGKPLTTEREVKFNWGSNSEVAKKHQKLFELGVGLQNGLPVTAGEGILERVQFLNQVPIKPGTTESTLKLVSTMQSSVAKAMEDHKGAKPEVINAEAQKLFDKQVNNWARAVIPGDQTNPFSLLSLGALDSSAELKTNPAYKYFRGVVSADEPADINKLIKTVLPAVKNGTVPLDSLVKVVSDVEFISRATRETKDDMYFLTGKQMPKLSVPVSYDVPLGRSPTKYIQPSDPVQVKEAIVRMIMPTLDFGSLFGTGSEALKPVVTKPGVK